MEFVDAKHFKISAYWSPVEDLTAKLHMTHSDHLLWYLGDRPSSIRCLLQMNSHRVEFCLAPYSQLQFNDAITMIPTKWPEVERFRASILMSSAYEALF